jgi:N-methylhydantoinase A
VYGSTVATNALLERRGARCALVTTAGFEDVLEIGRQARPALYDWTVRRPPPLVPRELRFGVRESIGPDGRIEIPLSDREVASLVRRLERAGVESVAICLLFSYANPAHERRLERALRSRRIECTASHQILPEFREYERTCTTVGNAYLVPNVGPALAEMRRRSRAARFAVLGSNGGRLGVAAAAAEPVRLLLSGPAGGALGAWRAAQRAGLRLAVAFDMGGTSTDVSLLNGGPPARLHEKEVAGLPVRIAMLDIHTVGAGGGSIASRDAGGALCVGPESAGADPGPACLGRGREPTVTDAHVVLGRLRPEHYLGGRVRLEPRLAFEAVAKLGRDLGLDARRTALGILQVANTTMERAVRVVTVERGIDVRELALVAFGGAGGLHAALLARGLGMRGALVPAQAAVLSAFGMAHADVEKDYGRSVLRRAPVRDLPALFTPLVARARREMRREGVARPRLFPGLDVRYVGQSHELFVPLRRGWERDFHQLHAQRFGFASPREPIEVVTVRLRAAESPRARREPRSRLRVRGGILRAFPRLPLSFDSGTRLRLLPTALVPAEHLAPGDRLRGPALVLRDDTTVLVPPGFALLVLASGDLWLQPGRLTT